MACEVPEFHTTLYMKGALRCLCDLFVEIEKHDRTVELVRITRIDSISLHVHLESNFVPVGPSCQSNVDNCVPSRVTVDRVLPFCHQCLVPWFKPGLHPDNGCPVADVYYIMDS